MSETSRAKFCTAGSWQLATCDLFDSLERVRNLIQGGDAAEICRPSSLAMHIGYLQPCGAHTTGRLVPFMTSFSCHKLVGNHWRDAVSNVNCSQPKGLGSRRPALILC